MVRHQPPIIYSPTTFVQAEPDAFRDLVQKLTGLTEDPQKLPATLPSRHCSRPADPTGPRRSPFKLQERRHGVSQLEIKLGLTTAALCDASPSHYSSRDQTQPSPMGPLGSPSFCFTSSGTTSPSSPALSDEEKAVSEKGFDLHPSQLSTPRGSEPPELLPLFPLTSPNQETKH